MKRLQKISGQTIFKIVATLCLVLLIGQVAMAKVPHQGVQIRTQVKLLPSENKGNKSRNKKNIINKKRIKRKNRRHRLQKARQANRIRQRLKRQQRRQVKRAIKRHSRKTSYQRNKHLGGKRQMVKNRKVKRTQRKKTQRKKIKKGEPFFVFRFAEWSVKKTGQLLHTTAALLIVPIALLSKLD